jgi:ubiquinone/menaquinone biosynthesis C-methylase UbiE
MQTVDFRYFPLHQGERVLDLGCGEGRHVISAYVLGEVHAVGVDLSRKDLSTAQARFAEFEEAGNEHKQLDLAEASALALPFPDASFDKVICSEVLEHIPDYRAALQEIRRVLKPDRPALYKRAAALARASVLGAQQALPPDAWRAPAYFSCRAPLG